MAVEGTPPRDEALDGLRGVAALVVFISHAIGLVTPWSAGTAAVDLFFVLSGFVLALPFVAARPRALAAGDFFVRRLFRSYPAYWAALVAALALRAFQRPDALAGLSPFIRSYQTYFAMPLSAGDLLRHAAMIGPSFDYLKIDPVIWSLIVEMRMSLFFPLVILALRRVHGPVGAAAIFGASLLLSFGGPALHLNTFGFLPAFVLGGLLARLREPVIGALRAIPSAAAFALALVGLALADVRSLATLDYAAADLVIQIGSALLIALTLARATATRALSGAVPAFLGRVSYGFYLVHLPILLVAAEVIDPVSATAITLTAIGSLAASLALSAALNRSVEEPFQRLGRRVANRIRRRAESNVIAPIGPRQDRAGAGESRGTLASWWVSGLRAGLRRGVRRRSRRAA